LAFFANVAAIDRERRRSELETLREVVELDRSVVIRWMHLVFHLSEKGVLAYIFGRLRIARVTIHDLRDALDVFRTRATEHSFDVCLILAARCVDFHEYEIGQGDDTQSRLIEALCHHGFMHPRLGTRNQIDPDVFLLPSPAKESKARVGKREVVASGCRRITGRAQPLLRALKVVRTDEKIDVLRGAFRHVRARCDAADNAKRDRPQKLASVHSDLRSGEFHQGFQVATTPAATPPAESSFDEKSSAVARRRKIHAVITLVTAA
jgi:hypothetical protein